jgi:hypothetical protein
MKNINWLKIIECATRKVQESQNSSHNFFNSIRKKLKLTSPTSGGRSIGVVSSWSQATEFSLVF